MSTTPDLEITIGHEYAFRDSDSVISQSVRAVVESIEPSGKSSFKYVIRLDNGRTRKVSRNRLKGPWSDAQELDEKINHFVRLLEQTGDEVEISAAQLVTERLIDCSIMGPGNHDTFEFFDREALSSFLEIDLDDLLRGVLNQDEERLTTISGLGGIRIAQRICEIHPEKVLNLVLEEEKEQKFKLQERSGLLGAEQAWDFYCKYYRSEFELIRQWCGHAAVRDYERARANELEIVRLDNLISDLLDKLKEFDEASAECFRQVWIREEFEPYKIRHTPARPLSPHEVPVRVEYRRGWRRW